MNKAEIERLNAISGFYEKGDYMDELIVDREMEFVQKYCNVKTNALEIGCGNGYSTKKLLAIFDDLEIVEPSRKNIAMMKDRVQCEVVCHNVLLEDFETDRKFDNVFFLTVLEHVLDPIDSLRQLGKLVSRNGNIYISVPNCMVLNRRVGYRLGFLRDYHDLSPKDYRVGHRRVYTVDELLRHCTEAGLRIITLKGIYLKPLPEKDMIELGDAKVRAFYALGEDIPQYCAVLFAVAKSL